VIVGNYKNKLRGLIMKAIETRLKPFYGLNKIAKEKANPSVIHRDNTIKYKFCNDYVYAEFTVNNTYPVSNDENVHYQIGSSFQEHFYSETMLHCIDQKFDLQSTFETVVHTKLLLSEVRSINIISSSPKLRNIVDIWLRGNEINLGFDLSLSDWSSVWLSMTTGESFNDGECYFRLNIKYLKLALSHGYKYTKICYSGVDKAILFYGYDHYSSYQDQNFRMLLMPVKSPL